MGSKRALILLGGTWHDFDGFAKSMKQILEPEGWIVDATYDFECMTQLDKKEYNLVVSYTCFSKQDWKGDPNVAEGFSDEQLDSLVQWVRSRGSFLASHAATIPGKTNPLLCEFIGGIFVKHPSECDFSIYPVYGEHPITKGIESFTVHDELYIQKFEPPLNIHMVALYDGTAYPVVWSKKEGKGLIAHIALGHSPKVWEHASYQKLMLQTVEWLTAK